MKLKQLTLQGFKSFADKTELSFDEGLTGIIGPNGCGKSNVVDAVKWVLGDQRPTSLRGKEMTDVIFGGAQGRAPMGCSEVLLTLERDPHPDELEMGHKQVETVIGRRLFRSGESEYLLNGQVVRLKDVKEALLDTGLGVGGYSVMEQGKIDAVLSANPEDRRNIFDEAAGISRYKLRRKEALRKLDRTEANLARISDVRQEKASRVRSLKIQATKARNYHEAESRLRALRVGVACLDSMEYRELLDSVDTRLEQAEQRVRQAEERRNEARQQKDERESQGRELVDRRNHLRELLAELRGDERSRRESLERAESRNTQLQQLRQRSGDDHERVRLDIEADREALEDLVVEGQEIEARLEHLEEELPQVDEAAREARRELKVARNGLEEAREAVLATIHERTRARNAVQSEEHEIQSLAGRRARLDREQKELGSKLEAIRTERRRERLILWDLEERRQRIEDLQARLDTRIASHRSEKQMVAGQLEELRHERSSLRSQQRVLQELEASHQGLDEAARDLLEEGHGVIGSLVEKLECPAPLGAALEAVLGTRVQALLLEDQGTVTRALEQLGSQEGKGRLVLLDGSKGAGAVAHKARAFEEDALGAEGEPLLDFVGIEADIAQFVVPLLRGVHLVPNLEAGQALVAGSEDIVAVTLRGEVLDEAWAMAGRVEASAGLLQRRARLAELEVDLESIETRLGELGIEEQGWESRLCRDELQRRRLERFSQSLLHRETAMQQSMRVRIAREEELVEEQEMAASERSELRRERSAALARLGTPLMNSWLLERRLERSEEAQREFQSKARSYEARVQETQSALSELQTSKAGLQAEQSGNSERRSILQRKLEDEQTRLGELEQLLSNTAEEIEKLLLSTAEWQVELEEVTGRLASTQEVADQFDGELAELEHKVEAIRRLVGEAETELEAARDARGQLVLDQREAGFKLKSLDDEIRSAYGVELARLRGDVRGRGLWLPGDFIGPELPMEGELRDRVVAESLEGPLMPPDYYAVEDALPRLWLEDDFDRHAVEQEIGVLRNKMQRMGAVNLAAEGELAAAEEEFETLEKDCRDLEDARKQLVDTLRKINLESRALFEETFHRARANFQDIFRMLFQGGKADIKLVESEDPLEAGIDIYAKPPGKELQSIRLLSGGERSMTALAILFAVFKVKPSPFCILDEVDAALDETNVERFLRVLNQFVRDTQFLVVTHHKRTMADCQVLYGITMPRRGISSRMSVSLRDVESGTVDDLLDGKAAKEAGTDTGRGGAGPAVDAARKQRIAGEEQVGFEMGN
ncbi:MAG: chromosome segregation protein SMC [Planctomycetota bacterium]|nr:MAG: chromosome segregation protein SMC [Planctomycetota bacterium]